MRTGAPRPRRLFSRSSFDEAVEEGATLRDFMIDLAIFGGEAVLSAACFRIAAGEDSVTFSMLGLLAAFAAALPLWDWMSGAEHPIAGRWQKGLPFFRHLSAPLTRGSSSDATRRPGPASVLASGNDVPAPSRRCDGGSHE